MEEQTLHYSIKLFNILFLICSVLILLYFFYFINNKEIFIKEPLIIEKGDRVDDILNNSIKNISSLDYYLFKIYYFTNNLVYKKFIHYGEFNIESPSNYNALFKVISKPSNIINKITIVEGWSSNELESELLKHFKKFNKIPYETLIADTYFLRKNEEFNNFSHKLKTIKKKYFYNHRDNKLLNNFSEDEIMIIGSLIEKEGLEYEDKKNISSVIFNRLKKNMKLQIDATVIYSITNGNYNLNRKLLLKDLKLKHPFNTYIINGLPPKPISYVGKSTLDIIFENYETDFLFYFYNNSLKRHIFSKTFEEHKLKLNAYRKNK